MLVTLQDGETIPWRYKVCPKNKVNAFFPAEIASNVDRAAVRSSMVGAAFHGVYNKVPKNEKCKILWEARHVFDLSHSYYHDHVISCHLMSCSKYVLNLYYNIIIIITKHVSLTLTRTGEDHNFCACGSHTS